MIWPNSWSLFTLYYLLKPRLPKVDLFVWNSSRLKIGHLLFRHYVRRKMIFLIKKFSFLFWTSELHVPQALWESPSTSSSNSIKAHGDMLFKICCKFISLVLFEELLYASTWLKLPKDWRVGCQKRSLFFSIESWVFNSSFLQFLFLLMVLYDVIFDVAAWIQIWKILIFFKKIYKFHGI